MIKIISVVGARPNFMKVAPIARALTKRNQEFKHVLVHTGQHYDVNMSDAFFTDLEMPQPDYFLGIGSGSHAEQTAKVMVEFEKVLIAEKPDLVIVVGDINSTVAAALTSVKLGIKCAHVEGGLRSNDRGMPEEINRIATDAICDYCFVTEKSAVKNLKSENFPEKNVFFVGNTMIDSQVYALAKADDSDILERLSIRANDYVLATVHRPSNVDNDHQLEDLLKAFKTISKKKTVILPAHPRTQKRIEEYQLKYLLDKGSIKVIDPVGYIDFLALMKNSFVVVTDSGGIQEETTALGVQCLTIRTSTERPVTCEIGTNKLISPNGESIINSFNELLEFGAKKGTLPELWDGNAAERIVTIISDLMK